MSEQLFSKPLEDEISFGDILDFLLESWKVIAVTGIIGGLLAVGYASVLSPKYQAEAYLEVAKVDGAEVEAPAVLLEKLKLPGYFSMESYSACNVIGREVKPSLVIVNHLKFALVKSTSMIRVSYEGDSPEDAEKCLMSLFNDIRTHQNLLVKPTVDRKKAELANLRLKLHALEKVTALPKVQPHSDLAIYILLNKELEALNLLEEINYLENSLLEPKTKDAFLVTSIQSSGKKVSPNRARFLTLGLISGLFLGLLFMIGMRRWHAYKMSS